jgi:hypothetical protein
MLRLLSFYPFISCCDKVIGTEIFSVVLVSWWPVQSFMCLNAVKTNVALAFVTLVLKTGLSCQTHHEDSQVY